MYLSLIIWMLLLLPGYAAARRWCRDYVDAGLLPAVGVSMLATWAMLTPVSIACYLLHLPVWVFSAAIVGLIIGGAYDLASARDARQRGMTLMRGALVAGVVIVVIDMVISAVAGGYLTGDASVHVTRVRYLLDHGFSNTDPFIGDYFWPIYHTNLYHALLAGVSQLSFQPYLDVWIGALAPMKLLIVCAVFTLGQRIFKSDLAGWAAVVFTIVYHMTGDLFAQLLVYPNTFVPWGLMPFAIVFALDAFSGSDGARRIDRGVLVRLTMISLLIGQMHGLYVLFVVAFIAVAVLAAGVLRRFTAKRSATMPLLAAAALSVGMIFPVVSAMGRAHTPSGGGGAAAMVEDDSARRGHFVRLDNGWVMRNYRRGLTAPGAWYRRVLLIAAMALVPTVFRRRESWLLIAAAVLVAAMLFIAPLCTLALRILGDTWIVLRAQMFFHLAFAVLVPGVAAVAVERMASARFVRKPGGSTRASIAERAVTAVFLIVLLIVSTWYSRSPARLGAYVGHAFDQPAERQRNMQKRAEARTFLEANVPRGETLLVEEELSALLPAIYDVYVVASRSTSLGVPDLQQRRRDLDAMLAPQTPWPTRRDLLRQYDVRYFLPTTPEQITWIAGHGRRLVQDPMLIEIDTSR